MKLHANARDITGQRFGRLVAVRPERRIFRKPRSTRILWLFKCDCGQDYSAVIDGVVSGKCRSCGCYRRDQQSQKPRALGSKHPPRITCATQSPLYDPAERVIAGFPLYTVTEDGLVYSYRNYRSGPKEELKQNWVKAQAAAGGYAFVNPFNNGNARKLAVHRLVAMAFLSKPESSEELVVRHLDGNSRNNHVSNLAWGTQKDNAADKRQHGRNLERGRHPMAKLDDAKVEVARAAFKAGYTYKQIGDFLGVAPTTIGTIIRNEHWVEAILGVPIETLKREREAA